MSEYQDTNINNNIKCSVTEVRLRWRKDCVFAVRLIFFHRPCVQITICFIVFFAEIKRQWEEFSHLYRSKSHGANPSQPFDFSVMSYNILSQQLLQENEYLYKHCHSSVLDWKHRFPSILKELKLHNADVSEAVILQCFPCYGCATSSLC